MPLRFGRDDEKKDPDRYNRIESFGKKAAGFRFSDLLTFHVVIDRSVGAEPSKSNPFSDQWCSSHCDKKLSIWIFFEKPLKNSHGTRKIFRYDL